MLKIIKITFFTIIISLITGVFSELSLKDDIKPIQDSYNIFYEFMYYQVFIIILLILLYFYNIKISKKKETIKNIEKNEIKNFKITKNLLIKNIKKLLKSVEILNKTEFYEKLNKFFREYFDLTGIKNTDTMTLKEIKKLDLNKNLILLFEQSYFNEFNDKKDTVKGREKLIINFIKIIK
ncbi:MAG: hypothetical protein QM490_05925 [Candidatus Gracilibacteria bacterium]